MQLYLWFAFVVVLIIIFAIAKAKYLDPPANDMAPGKLKYARLAGITILTFIAVFAGVFAVSTFGDRTKVK